MKQFCLCISLHLLFSRVLKPANNVVLYKSNLKIYIRIDKEQQLDYQITNIKAGRVKLSFISISTYQPFQFHKKSVLKLFALMYAINWHHQKIRKRNCIMLASNIECRFISSYNHVESNTKYELILHTKYSFYQYHIPCKE